MNAPDHVFLRARVWLRVGVLLLGSALGAVWPASGGVPYWFWSAQHELPSGQDRVGDDADGDGITNLEEYFQGTDPLAETSQRGLACWLSPAGDLLISYRRSKEIETVDAQLRVSDSPTAQEWFPLPNGSVVLSSVDLGDQEQITARLAPPSGGVRFYRLYLQSTGAAPAPGPDFGDWNPAADGVTDDGPKFKSFFQQIKNAGGGRVRIPAATYYIDILPANQCPIPSNVEVDATGAVFRFTETAETGTLFTWLQGTNVVNFIWKGGRFVARAFDAQLDPHTNNTWHPNARLRCVYIGTSPGGRTANILFDGVETSGIQGTALTVAGKLVNYYTVDTYARNVTLRRCQLVQSGPFLWDYGFIWQLVVWDYEYDENHRSLGQTYFEPRIFTAPVQAQGTRIEFDNSAGRVRLSTSADLAQTVCFYGDRVDSALVRGMAYYVVESDASHIKVGTAPYGAAIQLQGDGSNMRMMHDLSWAFYTLLAPPGSAWIPDGQGAHGAFMVDATIGVRAFGNRLERANGDAMIIRCSRDVDFSQNEIYGARMGAVWIGDLCENVLVRSNVVDGGNGSRVLSVERSSKDVIVSDNLFLNGGRGSWINAPRGILLSNNLFHPCTGKNRRDPYLGRRSYQTGDYELYDQIYFTAHGEPPYGGQPWGPVVIVDNTIDSGPGPVPPQCLRFMPGARDVFIAHNTFLGQSSYFLFYDGIERVTFGPNSGILTTNWGHYTQTVLDSPIASIRIQHGLADNSTFLSCVPSVTPNNPDSQPSRLTTTDTEIIVTFPTAVPVGRTIDLHWSAYLKFK